MVRCPTEALAQGVHVSDQGPEYGAEKRGSLTDKTGDESPGWMAKMGPAAWFAVLVFLRR